MIKTTIIPKAMTPDVSPMVAGSTVAVGPGVAGSVASRGVEIRVAALSLWRALTTETGLVADKDKLASMNPRINIFFDTLITVKYNMGDICL
jgi:hypothetical protein